VTYFGRTTPAKAKNGTADAASAAMPCTSGQYIAGTTLHIVCAPTATSAAIFVRSPCATGTAASITAPTFTRMSFRNPIIVLPSVVSATAKCGGGFYSTNLVA